MKYIKLFIASYVLFAMFSCDNTLNVTAELQSIPAVYALIDGSEEINYFRVERVFLDPEISGLELAQRPDSLYYGPEVTVRLTNLDNGNSVNLERVNLEDEGFTRNEGIFATQPNIGYKFRTEDLGLNVNQNERLKLELIDSQDRVMTEAETSVIGEYELPPGRPSELIAFIEDRDVNFGIRSDEQAARFYDLRVLFNYDEMENGAVTPKTLEWVIETNNERALTSASSGTFINLTVFKVEPLSFYTFIGANIEENSNVSRSFTSIDIRYDAGGDELLDYINIGQANTGITSNQIIPTFSNFTNDAVGVFSSRTTIRNIEPFNLNTITRDSLREGRFTENLNFN